MDNAKPFRFLELPAELRNRIIELAIERPKQPICIPNHLLWTSEDFADPRYVWRKCSGAFICVPCQLHSILDTGHIGLSRASQQLHREVSLVTYAVNTFSLHNLYQLQTFLHLIGKDARQHLKSLHFGYALPVQESLAFGLIADVAETFELLAECKSLVSLSVNIDEDNLRAWHESGHIRQVRNFGIPYLDRLGRLRGLNDIRIAWKRYQDSELIKGMVRTLAELWALPRDWNGVAPPSVRYEVKYSSDRVWKYIHWKAGVETSSPGWFEKLKWIDVV